MSSKFQDLSPGNSLAVAICLLGVAIVSAFVIAVATSVPDEEDVAVETLHQTSPVSPSSVSRGIEISIACPKDKRDLCTRMLAAAVEVARSDEP